MGYRGRETARLSVRDLTIPCRAAKMKRLSFYYIELLCGAEHERGCGIIQCQTQELSHRCAVRERQKLLPVSSGETVWLKRAALLRLPVVLRMIRYVLSPVLIIL